MKFLPVVLSVIAGVASAKKSFSGASLQQRINEGKFDKKKLMQNAKPYDRKTKRQLDQQEEWQINGYYTIKYDTCLNFQIEDEDLLDENIIQYAANGQVVAVKSYILFDVCVTQNCYYDEDDSRMTFVTDVPSFFEAFVEYLPNQVEEYCRGCEENQEYCQYNANMDGEVDGQQQNQGGRQLTGRKLANNKVYEYINCDLCEKYECYEDENENENENQNANQDQEVYEFEDALEWLYGLSECARIESDGDDEIMWNNLGLSAGLICNSDGSGVEVGVFVDDDCSIFAPGLSYANIMPYSHQQYYSMSTEVVQYMFTNDFTCYYEEIEYINPYSEIEEEEEQQDDYNYEAPEAAQWCQQLFNGNMEAVNMYDCGWDGNQDNNQNEEQEQDQNMVYYDWYTYDLSQEEMEEGYSVCMHIKELNGEFTHVYDEEQSGTLYNYKVNKGSGSGGLGAGPIIAIILGVIAVVAAGVVLYTKTKKADDQKKAPLINDGTMA